jgi:phenylpropionate dioxygenase-like ring-hydroxylating dioxygenase large terminal subunit
MEHVISIGELPYPNGWFAMAWSRELKPGRELRQRLMGEDVVLYRTREGTPVVTRPFCRDSYQVRECNGAVFAWRHADGRPPDWDLPELRDPRFASTRFMSTGRAWSRATARSSDTATGPGSSIPGPLAHRNQRKQLPPNRST